ncbi:MAG: hypothetical protein KUG81_01865 [Gammaproteobacteria bacterium]|nr:hypothetical protein [Gammaproteobacteria bacterium]
MKTSPVARLTALTYVAIGVVMFTAMSQDVFAKTFSVTATVVNQASSVTAQRVNQTTSTTIEAKEIKQWPRASRDDSLTDSGLYHSWELIIRGGHANSTLMITHGIAIVLPNDTIKLDDRGYGVVYIDVRTDVFGNEEEIFDVGFSY